MTERYVGIATQRLPRYARNDNGLFTSLPYPHQSEFPLDSHYHVSLGVPLFQQSTGILKHLKEKVNVATTSGKNGL